MKKKLFIALLFNLGVISIAQANIPHNGMNMPYNSMNMRGNMLEFQQLKYGNGLIAIGNINTSVTETIVLKPDIAEFSITYITEGATPNDASNHNTVNMKKLNEYLNQLGVSDDNLTTVGYQNYEQEQEQVIDNNKRYSSTFTIHLDINNQQFFEVVKLLDQNQINTIEQDSHDKYYIFNIQAISDSPDKAKKLSQEKYQLIANQLNKLGITGVSVAGYDNQVQEPDHKLVKKYYVQNAIQIKVNDLDLIGKIIGKAQELKMTVNNDMSYSVSESAKNAALEKYEQTIYTKLAEKAARLVGKQYQLGMPSNLFSDENSYTIQPRNYGYSRATINAGQSQSFEADNVEIQTPSEFTITLTMSGTFDIINKIVTN